MTKFLSPYTFSNGVVQKNRVVLAPMTNSQSHEDGTLSDAELHWLELRAKGGFGMIITAASHVQRDARAWVGQLGCFSDAQLPGLKRLAEIGKQNKSLTILQLFHGGIRCPRNLNGVQPTAPSVVTLDFPNFEPPRALTEPEIETIINNFVTAGMRAHAAGLSGVEVHGANGYLFTQFLSQLTNLRTDRWGGSLENRARLLTEVVRRLRLRVPAEFIIGVRLLAEDTPAQRGFHVQETLQVVKWLAELGVHYIHVSASDLAATSWHHQGDPETNLHRFRSALPATIALVAVGGIHDPKRANFALAEGADLIALGRAAISTPDWPVQAEREGFTPTAFPLTPDKAVSVGISAPFLSILRQFGLVQA